MRENKKRLYMSNLKFKRTHKFFRVTISSIKYTKNTNSDKISLHVYNNSLYKIILLLGLLGYCETNATISAKIEIACRFKNILRLLKLCQSIIFNEELSINIITSNKNKTQTISQKHLILNQHFRYQNTPLNNKKTLTMFNFQHTQITQKNLTN